MKKEQITIIVAICLAVVFLVSCFTCGGTSDGGNHSYTCGVCNREFSGGTSNSKSIIRTGMCSRCYSNYKYAIGD